MSRIRIVKGKITEIVGGDLRYFSEADIVESAADTYEEQSTSEILHDGNPEKPPPSPTLAKCMVFFRPTKDWKGEFGFDWVRVADSKLPVDNPYKGNIWEYGSIYASEEGATFTPDNNKYKSILGEYNSFNVYKGIYYVPNMTLKEGDTATLDAIVHVEEKADSLHYAYNTDVFDLTILKKFTVAEGKNHDESSLSIKCKKAFSSPETIRVIATVNKRKEKIGEIKIFPNSTKHIKNINVVIIPVENNGVIGHFINHEKQTLVNALKQSYIDPVIDTFKTPINADTRWFNFWFKSGKKLDTSMVFSIHNHLDKIFFKIGDNKAKYTNYYRIYMLKGADIAINGEAAHIEKPNSSVVVFDRPVNGRSKSTMAHELLHAMALYHTFDNNSQYTFKYQKTDNIMDYTHQLRKDRFSTNKFQWKKINSEII